MTTTTIVSGRAIRAFASAASVVIAIAASGSGGSAESGAAAGAAPVRLGLPGVANSAVSVAADGAQVVVTWAVRSAVSTDAYAARSRDGGASFAPPMRVNDVDGDVRVSGEQPPRVALGPGVEVVWVARRGSASLVRAAKTRTTEGGFAPAVTIHAENLPGLRGWPSLAVDRDGGTHVAWLDGRDGPAERAAAAPGVAPRHMAMRQDLFHAVWRPDGTRDEVKVAADVCFCCKTAVATGRDGAVYVAWRHIYPPNLRDIAVARSSDGGRTFGAPVRVSEDRWAIDGCPDDGPSMAVDGRGAVHIAWPTMVEGSRPGKGIFYSYSVDGGRTFAPRVRVDDAGGEPAHPQLAVADEGAAVVWDEGGPPRRVYLRVIARDPAPVGKPRLGPISLLSSDQRAVYPAVAATSKAYVAAWTEDGPAGSEIRVRRIGP